MKVPATGTVLVADPFLKDAHFMRSAIFLCEHRAEGSFGFILNRKYNQTIGELLTDLEGCNFPVYFGGPVQMDTIHFLHQCPHIITDGVEITNGIYWGGEFEKILFNIHTKKIGPEDIRFYIGYSGWAEGQLTNELQEKSWLLTEGSKQLVFHQNTDLIWQDAIKQIGGDYEQLIHYPIDPQLN